MSEAVLLKWYEHCKTNLECHTTQRLFMERDIKDPLRSSNARSNLRLKKDKINTVITNEEQQVNTKKLGKWEVEPYLLAHEFLYLLCNCEDRLNAIRKIHNNRVDT